VRTVFAASENVPPYVVFSDATLVEMATYLPQNGGNAKNFRRRRFEIGKIRRGFSAQEIKNY
jgi:superfamily II DNA helicase RecQ